MILLQEGKKNRTRLCEKNVPEINIEQIEGNDKFYIYLYPLGT
jgi:hypothetical protein